MKCHICGKDKDSDDDLYYDTVHPLPITKAQEQRGVLPRGDVIIKTCIYCKTDTVRFYNPETGEEI